MDISVPCAAVRSGNRKGGAWGRHRRQGRPDQGDQEGRVSGKVPDHRARRVRRPADRPWLVVPLPGPPVQKGVLQAHLRRQAATERYGGQRSEDPRRGAQHGGRVTHRSRPKELHLVRRSRHNQEGSGTFR